jgi:drug/metabolite transporter (DMT)-like permease
MASSRMSRTSLAMLLVLALAWGSSFMFIKIGVRTLDPSVVMLGRCAIGALVLWGIAGLGSAFGGASAEVDASRWRRRLDLLILGAMTALPFGLIAQGEQHIASSTAGIVNATVPLWSVVMSARWDVDHPTTWLRYVGVGVGFAGVVGLIASTAHDSASHSGEVWALVGVALAALIYAGSGVFARVRLREVDPVRLAAAAITWAALLFLPPALAHLPDSVPNGGAIAAVAALGVIGTGLGFFLYYQLLDRIGAARSSLVTYLMPPVAVVYGVVFLDEHVGWDAAGALVCILAGVWVGSLGGKRSPRRNPA